MCVQGLCPCVHMNENVLFEQKEKPVLWKAFETAF
jgi:hypothetical protein